MRRLRHDMRTPLSQIIGYSELLEEEVSDRGHDDLVPDLEKIRGAAKTLLLLVDEYFSGEPAAREVEPPPRAKDEMAAEAVNGEQPSGPGGSILVVDDEANNRDILARKLVGRGFGVDVAENGESALSKVWNGNYDLVILDIMMPGISGIEVLEAIRKERSATDLPVIMATAPLTRCASVRTTT